MEVNLFREIVCVLFLFGSVVNTDYPTPNFSFVTSLIKEDDVPVLVLSTLEGSFIGIDQWTGNIRWKLMNEPTVKVPVDAKEASLPMFLPDPKDGSLYLLSKNTDELKKLPFTIPQLVASSPCRSSDGIFYTGRKIDSWFAVNWKTGHKKTFMTFDQSEKTCPVSEPDHVFIGRTEYNLIMYDGKKHGKHWNLTFFDYSAHALQSDQLANYELAHFGGSASGRVSTFDRRSGALLWEKDFGSPLVAVYARSCRSCGGGGGSATSGGVHSLNQDLVAVPFASVDDATLDRLPLANGHNDQLFPTLYIGEHSHGLYALPSLVGGDGTTLPMLSEARRQPLIDGPRYNLSSSDRALLLLAGHYQMPEYSSTRLQIAGRSDKVIPPGLVQLNGTKGPVPAATAAAAAAEFQTQATQASRWMDSFENRLLASIVAALVLSMIAMFMYLRAQVKEFQQLSESGSRGSGESSGASGTNEAATASAAELLPDGSVRVGKISFSLQNVLGKGCEGTFVFRGEFDGRRVAVKRLLPECFTLAEREVRMLRESDAHPNVVRYFCTEHDPHTQFRYIALELAAATLQDYVERNKFTDAISPEQVIQQSTAGLKHLHNLNIVHRDIKPHNVLLSLPGCSLSSSSASSGEVSDGGLRVRAMISDFGLCKKLQLGRTSFSRTSGITGTDGWIAPEMLLNNRPTTCSVDIFSLGCVFYYVLSKGKHPFGDPLRRQANILSSEYDLSALSVDDWRPWRTLISKMIAAEPGARPPVRVVASHPSFWPKSKVLAFLQDVSDRVEKEDSREASLQALECGSARVCGAAGDWRLQLEPEMAAELRKYRAYRGDSVRDLLRALRNKKHHLRELSEEARLSVGASVDSFVDYWLSRFPALFEHSWTAMQCVRHEHMFANYYCEQFEFPPLEQHQSTIDGDMALPLAVGGDLEMVPAQKKTPRRSKPMGGGGGSRMRSRQEVSNDENDKERWRQNGERNGFWRPRHRARRAKNESEDGNFTWVLPAN